MLFRRVAAACTLSANFLLAQPCATSPTFSDSIFSDSDWEFAFVPVGPGGSAAVGQSGLGNPAPARSINITINPGGTLTNLAYVLAFSGKRSAIWHPATSGPILSLDYCEDARAVAANSIQASGLALKQNGKIYLAKPGTLFSPNQPSAWMTLIGNYRQSDFVELTGKPPAADAGAAPGTTAIYGGPPDFSVSGAPIEFGFYRANSGANGYTSQSLIDNWRVKVNTTVLFPVDDSYATVAGQGLMVPAPGVLGNDTGPGTLSAVLESGPANGTLTLNADGSLAYSHNPGFVGRDSFRYRVRSGGITSSTAAVVTIIVASGGTATCFLTPASHLEYYPPGVRFQFRYSIQVLLGSVPLAGAPVRAQPATGFPLGVSRTNHAGIVQVVFEPHHPFDDFMNAVDDYVAPEAGPAFSCVGPLTLQESIFSVPLEVCAAIFGGRASISPPQGGEDPLDLFRRFRDRVLTRSGQGQDYAKQYYRFRPEFGRILLTNPGLLLRIREKVKRHAPLVEALVDGRPGVFSRSELQELEALAREPEAKSSPELRKVLVHLRHDMFDPQVMARHGIIIRETPATVASSAANNSLREAFRKLPLSFEAAGTGSYVARGPGYQLRLKPAEAGFDLDHGATRVRMKLSGARASPGRAESPLPGITNYLWGANPKTWRSGVRSYARVKYENVYPGIDLVYYGNQRRVEHDFVVAPGALPERIALAFTGIEKVEVDASGDLLLRQKAGDLRLRRPVVYQEIDGERRLIAGAYSVKDGGRTGFHIGEYDKTQPLVIDPVLSYSSYLGGAGLEASMAIAVDAQGNAFVTGATTSANFASLGSFQQRPGGAGQFGADGFVTKFDPTGTQVLYSTYFGGSDDDIGTGITVDAQGNAYVTGLTRSANFPTLQPMQRNFGGAGQVFKTDAFVLKLNPGGLGLVYSTYLGGSGDDLARGIAVDSAGNVYVTGATSSNNFPLAGAVQRANAGGQQYQLDAFAAKINFAGSALVYSTYLGGSGDDAAGSVAVDSAGNAYLTGVTFSANFPLQNPLQRTFGGGADVFAAKLNSAGSALVYSTYLGGKGSDYGTGVAVDAQGNAYLTGITGSATDFPRLNSAQTGFGDGDPGGVDAFVTKLNAAGSALVYSTFLGGKGLDFAYGIAVDAQGSAYIAGETGSPDFSARGSLLTAPGGKRDGFLAKLNSAGAAFEYRNYLGGSEDDGATALAVDRSGNVYVSGSSGSADSPATFASYQTGLQGPTDAWIVKIGSGTGPPLLASVSAASQMGATGLAPESIGTGYGTGLAAGLTVAGSTPPTSLAGVSLTIRDAAGTDRFAQLYFVSPGQINYVVPAGTREGLAAVTVTRDGQVAATGTARIQKVAPALFTANNTGRGAPAALTLRAAADGSRTTTPVFRCGDAPGSCVPDPIDLGPDDDQVYLLLFGTGIRSLTQAVTATVGGVNVPVLGAAPQAEFAGMDQVNIGPLPRSLVAKGELDLVVSVDGKAANPVKVSIK